MDSQGLKLHAGELVEVRSYHEIVHTLDERGTLEGLPFMPEMKKFCGKRFKVFKRAERVCVEHHKARGMDDTVFLEGTRCGGNFHGGCKVNCLLFWKEAWVKRVNGDSSPSEGVSETISDVFPYPTRDPETGRYSCQASELPNATFSIGLWGNAKTYYKDLVYGNLSIQQFLKAIYLYLLTKIKKRSWKRECGTLLGELVKTPAGEPNLQPGDLVEVKSAMEIAQTLDVYGRNRGLFFAVNMLAYCGKRYRVMTRIDNAINEQNGQMLHLNSTVLLETVTCDGMCKRGCPRNGYIYWRDIWLRKINEGGALEREAGISNSPAPLGLELIATAK